MVWGSHLRCEEGLGGHEVLLVRHGARERLVDLSEELGVLLGGYGAVTLGSTLDSTLGSSLGSATVGRGRVSRSGSTLGHSSGLGDGPSAALLAAEHTGNGRACDRKTPGAHNKPIV